MSSLSGRTFAPESAQADLQVHFLGPPGIAWRGDPLQLLRRQARALLYRLADSPQLVARERICFLFWPDAPEVTARSNLSRLISIIRGALPDPALLISSDDRIGLARQGLWSDTQAFEQDWAAWKAGGQPSALQQAVTLYRGSFLEGFSLPDSTEFEAWLTTERQRWERLALQALAALVDDQASRGENANAIAYAQRYLAIDPLNEPIHRQLIMLYALTGDRAAAARQYERLAAILEQELGLEPLPETQAVHREVQAGGAPWAFSPAPPPYRSIAGQPDVPLVGREDAWRTLDEVYSRTCGGRGKVVLISGEAGIGKSRLMQDFCASVQGRCTLLTGACYPETQVSPYQPLVEALRSGPSLRMLGSGANPACLSEASRLLPELRALHTGLPEPPVSEPGWARARLFEALAMILSSMAWCARPLLLVLDDLHCADPATLDWLAYMGHHLVSRRLMILGSYRSEEATPVAQLRDRLARHGVLREILLAGLDQKATYRLLCHFDADFCDRIALAERMGAATGGNPFFLLETARALIESGQRPGQAASPESIALPESVRSVVQARVKLLGPAARQLLEAAAVLGAAFDFDLARMVAGRQEGEAIEAFDELLSRQLLATHDGGYRFRHELAREAIYLDLSLYRRHLLHRRAAQGLLKLRSADAATLARHLELAEQPGQAAHYALRAGLVARQLYAHVEARQWSDRALALLDREASSLVDPPAISANLLARVEALNLRGWALRLVGDMAAYAADLEEEGRVALQLGDDRALAHLRHRQAYAHRWFCRYARALQVAEEGLHLSQAARDRRLEGMCWREVGLAARSLGQYPRAETALLHAWKLLDAPDQAGLRVHVLGHLSTLYLYAGDFPRALDLAQQALALCEKAQLALERRVPLGDLGAAAAALRDGETARRCLEESLVLARQVADRTQEILDLGHLGWLDLQEARAGAACQHLAAALSLAEEINSLGEQSWLHAGLAEAHNLAGDRFQALSHAQCALAIAEASGCVRDQELSEEVLARLCDESTA